MRPCRDMASLIEWLCDMREDYIHYGVTAEEVIDELETIIDDYTCKKVRYRARTREWTFPSSAPASVACVRLGPPEVRKAHWLCVTAQGPHRVGREVARSMLARRRA